MAPGHRHLAPALLAAAAAVAASPPAAPAPAPAFRVTEDPERIRIAGPVLEAAVRKKGYVSGVEAGSLRDVKTGFRDLGYGLDVVDWLMEPGSDAAYRDRLPGDLPYVFDNLVHGRRPKRCVEGPQVCTRAGSLSPTVVTGKDFVAVKQDYTYKVAAPGRRAGSTWGQTVVVPAGERYFLAADRVTTVNASDALSSASTCRGTSGTRAGILSARCT